MDPTLKDGEIVLVTPWTSLIPLPWNKSLTRGDVVIVKHPHNPNDWLCKRVIGKSQVNPEGFSGKDNKIFKAALFFITVEIQLQEKCLFADSKCQVLQLGRAWSKCSLI